MDRERFSFWAGATILVKAAPASEGDDIIYIEASNEKEDQQSDTVLQKALKAQMADFLKKGVISFEHLHKKENDPKFVIGEPLEVKFTDDGRTLVKARLYKSNPIASDILSKLKDAPTRLGASIGGYVKKRADIYSNKLKKVINYVTEIKWDEVALTFKPVNDATIDGVSVTPFSAFAKAFSDEGGEAVEKALEAGSSTDHANMNGGRAIVTESLDGGVSKAQRVKKIADLIRRVKAGEFKNFAAFKSHVEKEGIGDPVTLQKLIGKNIKKISAL